MTNNANLIVENKELKLLVADLLEALKEIFASYEALNQNTQLDNLENDMLRLTSAFFKAKQTIDFAEKEV